MHVLLQRVCVILVELFCGDRLWRVAFIFSTACGAGVWEWCRGDIWLERKEIYHWRWSWFVYYGLIIAFLVLVGEGMCVCLWFETFIGSKSKVIMMLIIPWIMSFISLTKMVCIRLEFLGWDVYRSIFGINQMRGGMTEKCATWYEPPYEQLQLQCSHRLPRESEYVSP